MKVLKECMEALRNELNDIMDDIDNCDRLKLLETSKKMDNIICEYLT